MAEENSKSGIRSCDVKQKGRQRETRTEAQKDKQTDREKEGGEEEAQRQTNKFRDG